MLLFLVGYKNLHNLVISNEVVDALNMQNFRGYTVANKQKVNHTYKGNAKPYTKTSSDREICRTCRTCPADFC